MNEAKERLERRNSWYLRGWEQREIPEPGGRKRVDWVYTGAWYDFPADAPRLKIKVTLAVALAILLAVYVTISLCPALGNRTGYVSYPCFAAVIALLYDVLGTFWLVVTPEKMTYRRYHASARRLRGACAAGAILMGLTAAAEAVCMVSRFAEISRVWDPCLLIGALICAGQYGIGWRTLQKYPVTELQSGKTTS